jgi:hypothetical protein
MESAKPIPHAKALPSFLAGLQAGWLGVFAMLVWLGLSAAWQQRSFWTAENLMASVFWGTGAIHTGFAGRTLSGLSVYVLLYSVLGGFLAWVVRDRLAPARVLLVSLVFAMAWYYLSYRLLWRSLAPLVSLLHVERATMLGHLVYGTLLGRYPVYLRAPKVDPPPAVEAPPAEEPLAAEPRVDAAPAGDPQATTIDPGQSGS